MNITESTTEPKEELSKPHPKTPIQYQKTERSYVVPDPRDSAKRAVKVMYRDINRLEEENRKFKSRIRWKINTLAVLVAIIIAILIFKN